MTVVRYTATSGGRFSWQDFGQPDTEEVVAYDHQRALTHLIDGLAMDVFRLLERHPEGLTPQQVARALQPDDQQPAMQDDNGEQDITADEASVVAEMLKLMHSIGMVARVPAVAG